MIEAAETERVGRPQVGVLLDETLRVEELLDPLATGQASVVLALLADLEVLLVLADVEQLLAAVTTDPEIGG
jgi:hypothetical protein